MDNIVTKDFKWDDRYQVEIEDKKLFKGKLLILINDIF